MIGLKALHEKFSQIREVFTDTHDTANIQYCTESAAQLIHLSQAQEKLVLSPIEERLLQLRIAEEFAQRVSHMLPRSGAHLIDGINSREKASLQRVSERLHEEADEFVQTHQEEPLFAHDVMDLLGRQLAMEHVNQFMDSTHHSEGLDALREIVLSFQKYRLPTADSHTD